MHERARADLANALYNTSLWPNLHDLAFLIVHLTGTRSVLFVPRPTTLSPFVSASSLSYYPSRCAIKGCSALTVARRGEPSKPISVFNLFVEPGL